MSVLIMMALMFAVPVVVATRGGDGDSGSSEHGSYERIRIYPSDRRAIRYYNGKREEHTY